MDDPCVAQMVGGLLGQNVPVQEERIRGLGEVEPVPTCPEVSIQKVQNGFIVHVGCKTFVSQSWDEVSEGLSDYYAHPAKAIRKWVKGGSLVNG